MPHPSSVTDLPAWIAEGIELLASMSPAEPRRLEGQGVVVVRIGRNQVWKLTSRRDPGAMVCAKVWKSEVHFQREVEGRTLLNSLALEHPWLMGAQIVHANPATGIIVTEWLDGESFERLLARSLDRLCPRVGRRASLARTAQCLDLILRLLDVLRRLDPSSLEHGADHRIGPLIQNINRMAREMVDDDRSRSLSRLADFRIDADDIVKRINPVPDCLVYGDFAPRNVVLGGGRIGLFDLEDMGVGPRYRDQVNLLYFLERLERHPRYASTASLRRRLELPREMRDIEEIHRVAFLMSELDLCYWTHKADGPLRKLAARFEQRRLVDRLTRNRLGRGGFGE